MPVRAKGRAVHPEFKVRRATEADLDVLANHRNLMFKEMFRDLPLDYRGYEKRFKTWARKMLRARRLIPFLVTDHDGKVVAGGSLWLRENHPSPRYRGTLQPYLMSMFTEPAYRRRGLATLIVKEAIDWSRKHGYSRLVLHASDMGEPVYAKLGFERTSEMRLFLDSAHLGIRSPSHARPSDVTSRRR
jgi:GNAT superfamily N-acetyltransferase